MIQCLESPLIRWKLIASKVEIVGRCQGREFERREVSFEYGEGGKEGVVEGVEMALGTFSRNEKARLKVKSCLAYGEFGCLVHRISPHCDLEYDVHLKDCRRVVVVGVVLVLVVVVVVIVVFRVSVNVVVVFGMVVVSVILTTVVLAVMITMVVKKSSQNDKINVVGYKLLINKIFKSSFNSQPNVTSSPSPPQMKDFWDMSIQEKVQQAQKDKLKGMEYFKVG